MIQEKGRLLYPVIASGLVLAGYFAVASFMAKNPDLAFKLQRQPIVQKLEGVEYALRSEPEVKAVEVNGLEVKTAPEFYLLPSAKWVPQTFNNCGPATTSMVLQYFGFNAGQEETKAALRTNSDDKNVFAYEIASYLRQDFQIESKILFNGNRETIKRLIANGIYVGEVTTIAWLAGVIALVAVADAGVSLVTYIADDSY